MHGNVAEWTRSVYRPYPYTAEADRAAPGPTDRVVVRGGSWRDLPKWCTSSFRLGYLPFQSVYNVGFRVVSEGKPDAVAAK
jgi:formylglycine-generating enzyme required for sulfatase activity